MMALEELNLQAFAMLASIAGRRPTLLHHLMDRQEDCVLLEGEEFRATKITNTSIRLQE